MNGFPDWADATGEVIAALARKYGAGARPAAALALLLAGYLAARCCVRSVQACAGSMRWCSACTCAAARGPRRGRWPRRGCWARSCSGW